LTAAGPPGKDYSYTHDDVEVDDEEPMPPSSARSAHRRAVILCGITMTEAKRPAIQQDLAFRALTPERWSDLEELFGARGACGVCWCMWWRFTRSEFEKQKGEKNKAAFKAVVDSGEAPGILAYANGRPIG